MGRRVKLPKITHLLWEVFVHCRVLISSFYQHLLTWILDLDLFWQFSVRVLWLPWKCYPACWMLFHLLSISSCLSSLCLLPHILFIPIYSHLLKNSIHELKYFQSLYFQFLIFLFIKLRPYLQLNLIISWYLFSSFEVLDLIFSCVWKHLFSSKNWVTCVCSKLSHYFLNFPPITLLVVWIFL